jgi:CubicO group peptidase (beta-lactamase class C family)
VPSSHPVSRALIERSTGILGRLGRFEPVRKDLGRATRERHERRLVSARRRVLLAFALLAVAPRPYAAAEPDLADLEPFVDGIVASHLARDHVAGAQVAIVKDGRALLIKGYGLAASAPQRPVDAQRSLFRLASISKTFTWIALVQLAERGKLRLEDPINAHLPPELAIPDDGWRQPIRILDLMNHSAGFEEQAYFEAPRDDAKLITLKTALQERRPQRVRPPGRLSVYSNYGAALAGAIIAHVSGSDFETYVEQHLLAPLGMAHTTFREPYRARAPRGLPAPMPPQLVADLARAQEWTDGHWKPVPFEHALSDAPAASASSTAADMARYMLALLDPAALERAGVLTTSSWQLLTRESWRPAPGVSGFHHGFFAVPPGIFHTLGHATLSHGGNMAHFESDMSLVPALGLGVFVTTNSATGVMLSRVLKDHVLSRYFPPAAPAPAPTASDRPLSEYAGNYRDLRRSYTRIHALFGIDDVREIEAGSGSCLLIATRIEPPACFVPIGRDLFQKRGGDARIAFLRASDGAISHVVGALNAERMGFVDTGVWLRAWLLAGLIAALATLWDAYRRRRRPIEQSAWQRRAAQLLTAAAGFWLAFGVAGCTWQLRHADAVFDGYPQPLLVGGLALLLIAIALSAAAGAMLPGVWRSAGWSLGRRLQHTATLLAFFGVTLSLQRWNVVGFHF